MSSNPLDELARDAQFRRDAIATLEDDRDALISRAIWIGKAYEKGEIRAHRIADRTPDVGPAIGIHPDMPSLVDMARDVLNVIAIDDAIARLEDL